MTIDTMTILMNKLTQLHKSLLTVSQAKTEALKHNGIEEMQKLLQKERKHVQAVKQIEKQRAEAAAEWFEEQGYTGQEQTVSAMLELLSGEEKEELQRVYEALIFVLSDLKQQEALNAELIQQSMQFIHLSLNTLEPSIQSMNYGNQRQEAPKRSLFDSKA
ncbi:MULTISPECIES: flagellar protein FlgN [Halobacillus]|uniref:flagellar protein FlgN n=1 Tax=Halobacillus TaxID=45667 RepID=UPI00136B3FB4|nr:MULTISPECIES: flagellar protein FlgN [Halobacillus]MYL30981.1 flagellar protein FlgN [Halobacillus halophilus]MYL36218.1 flagellar protein FlgN [Halobacillus litoralis]